MQIKDFESAYYEAGYNSAERDFLREAELAEQEGDVKRKELCYRTASRLKWNRIPIGYWYSKYQPNLPKPESNSSILSPEETEKICEYLDLKTHRQIRYAGTSECRICGKDNGFADKYDDIYVWPQGLSHYLKEHNCELPDEFTDYCLAILENSGGTQT